MQTFFKLTLETLCLRDSKSCPENAMYNPVTLTIKARSGFKFLFN